ncbi:biosynthetic-type acetolactate synthase large subunit [soil metagenome]
MKITGSQAVLESLLKENVKIIFGYPGGAIMPIYDALYDYMDRIKHVLVRHEQGAGHAAEGYGRITGEPGVCFATSGPGATNLVTAIADAMMDSVPMICITGQVSSAVLGTDAFQEADVIGITAPITKWNYQISDANEIPEIMSHAFHIARTGRPGPVLIDITKDAQFQTFDFEYPKEVHIDSYQPTVIPHAKQIELAAELLNSAERPYILVGHGVTIAKAEKQLKEFLEKGGYPAACTLHGLSALPSAHPLHVGFLGMHGNYGPNVLSNKADVVLAIGMRFDDRVTGHLTGYLKNAKVIHIDIDPAELNKIVIAEIPIVADAKNALIELTKAIKENSHTAWIEEFRKCDVQELEKVIKHETHPEEGMIKMAEAVNTICEITRGEAIIVADVGQHQMIAARYYKFTKNNSFVSSGGMGTMGFSLPAAMGAKYAAPDRDVISISGDGGIQMNIQELATLAQENLPVKVVILNNNFLGMVRQWQQLFFDKRYSMVEMKNPDFIQVAKGFYIEGKRVEKREELAESIETMLKHNGPYVLEIMVEKEGNVFPMVPTGASVDDIRLE